MVRPKLAVKITFGKETRKPSKYLYKLDGSCSYHLETISIRFVMKFSIRPYMTHVSKPTIKIKHMARFLKDGDAARCCSSLHNKQASSFYLAQ